MTFSEAYDKPLTMPTALSQLRTALSQHFVDRSWARLWALRNQDSAWTPIERQRAHFLLSASADEAMAEIEARGQLAGPGLRRLREHLAGARLQLRLATASTSLSAVLREPDRERGELPAQVWRSVGDEPDPRARAERMRQLAKACGEPVLHYLLAYHDTEGQGSSKVSEEVALQQQRASAFLSRTEAVAREVFPELASRHSEGGRPGLSGLWHGLRASPCDGAFSPRRRMARVARFTDPVGLQRPMSQRVRVEVDRFTLWPGGLLPLSVPEDLRLLDSAAVAGPQAEAAALAAVGGGLALSLMPGDLPPEDRWPLPDGPASALSGLCLQWLPDPTYLRLMYGLSGKELERAQRAAAAAVLFMLRLSCHFALSRDGADAAFEDAADLGARLASACGELLYVPVQPREVGLIAISPDVACARASGQLCGLRLHGAVRERLDDDYFRNPRFAEVVQTMTARGHQLTTADLDTEFGASEADPANRVLEWF